MTFLIVTINFNVIRNMLARDMSYSKCVVYDTIFCINLIIFACGRLMVAAVADCVAEIRYCNSMHWPDEVPSNCEYHRQANSVPCSKSGDQSIHILLLYLDCDRRRNIFDRSRDRVWNWACFVFLYDLLQWMKNKRNDWTLMRHT